MNYNVPMVSGEHPTLEGSVGNAKLYRDNRNIGRRDVGLCKPGDFFKPWYYFRDDGRGHTGAPISIPNICLVYKITEEEIDVDHLITPCFWEVDYTQPTKEFLDAIAEGQRTFIDCVRHAKAVGAGLRFFYEQRPDSLNPESLYIYDGNHRAHALRQLGIKTARVRVFNLLDFTEGFDIEARYNEVFPALWDTYREFSRAEKAPWFPLESFERPAMSGKIHALRECLLAVPDSIKSGVDVGCAEGLFTFYTTNFLNIKMTGIDSEANRIVRAMLMRTKHEDVDSVNFEVRSWDNIPGADLVLAMSILHHMDNPELFFNQLDHARCLILEARFGVPGEIPTGTIKRFQTRDKVESLLVGYGFSEWNLAASIGDRHFYTGLRP